VGGGPGGGCDAAGGKVEKRFQTGAVTGIRARTRIIIRYLFHLERLLTNLMFAQYIQAALEKAEYEIIDNPDPYYAHVPGLVGVWATARPSKNAGGN
jgi:hypothetical protein